MVTLTAARSITSISWIDELKRQSSAAQIGLRSPRSRLVTQRWLVRSRQACMNRAAAWLWANVPASRLCMAVEAPVPFPVCLGSIERNWAGDQVHSLLREWSGSVAPPFTWPGSEAAAALTITALVSSSEALVGYEAGDVDRSTRARNNLRRCRCGDCVRPSRFSAVPE